MASAKFNLADLSPQAETALYLKGIDLFNAGEFFAAHEVWEDLWRGSREVKREYYQGLVQCAVALEHFRRGNARGALRLYDTCRRHFSHVPDTFMGVDIVRFLAGMQHALQPALDRPKSPEHGEMVLDPLRVPPLCLEIAAQKP